LKLLNFNALAAKEKINYIMYHKDRPSSIQKMFNIIAPRYDLTNSILSFRLHKYWNRSLIRHLNLLPSHLSHVYVDLCAGTGDITIEYIKKLSNPCQIHLLDFSAEMLEQAKIKLSQKNLKDHTIHYFQTDVHELSFTDESVDVMTMAYGIRNVQNPMQCIQEIFRTLKPGGRIGILELTRPTHPFLRICHQVYLKKFLPIIGRWLTTNQEAYQYLCQSIHTFISPQKIEEMLHTQGFVIATILIGYKS
jgi:demethylmenaquinone methyltransferase/2-methoxy-6-polyprenyl-1,4-benzoquinol methylase